MAYTAHKDAESIKEHRDPPEVLGVKVRKLAELINKSSHFVTFTGAGISTSAGIPDFRGPNGKWTCQAQNRSFESGVPAVRALPTAAHMALVELQRRTVLKYLISQNCDGLHRRSGFPAASLSELHGNGNVEICEDCGISYFRDFCCTRMKQGYDHFTGRFCNCGGRLLNSTIDFGQGLPAKPLELAEMHSRLADLHLVLGSSLTVSPACDMPHITGKKKKAHLVICNLQKTPLSDVADFQIFAETDVVMKMLMQELGLAIPPFKLQRRVIASLSAKKSQVSVKAVEIHDPSIEIGILRAVNWDGKDDEAQIKKAYELTHSIVAERVGLHKRSVEGLDLSVVRPTLHFVGHYREPPYKLDVDLSQHEAVDVTLSFDPCIGSWSLERQEPLSIDEAERTSSANGPEFGTSHREYCENMWMNKHGKSAEEASRIVADKALKAKEQALSVSYALGGAARCGAYGA